MLVYGDRLYEMAAVSPNAIPLSYFQSQGYTAKISMNSSNVGQSVFYSGVDYLVAFADDTSNDPFALPGDTTDPLLMF